jgi:hypothetical protein
LKPEAPEVANDLASAWSKALRENNITKFTREVYVIADQDLWKKRAKANLAQAMGVIQKECFQDRPGFRIKTDWIARLIFCTASGGREQLVCTWSHAKGIIWHIEALRIVCPDCPSIATLRMAMEM